MEASASEFEDRELAEALKRSKSEAPSTSAASAASAAGSSTDPKLTILPTDKFTEEAVQQLVGYKFSREQVLHLFRRSDQCLAKRENCSLAQTVDLISNKALMILMS